jgi:lysyl-tRNA synthetase, class I
LDSEEITFWADDLANSIIHRKSYNYIDKKVPDLKVLTIKSSTSISGVPHIGNASDVFRAEAVVRALRDAGQKVRFIWVAENMDPLRKVPAGIPDSFEQYLGQSVSDLPDPEGCCGSYSEHFVNLFMDSLREQFGVTLEVLYMHKIYASGQLYPMIKLALDKIDRLREIINQYREKPLPVNWIPWNPICENCGKIITTRMTGRDGDEVSYSCEDYQFKHRKILGCHYKGVSNIRKGHGKLLWRVEWASQWPLWKIVFEPYGKEHGVNCPHETGAPIVGSGSFWVAGNVCEEIFDWPEPCPTKGPNPLQPYEYVLIGKQKMSSSKGNCIATWDWPTFSSPQSLKLFFLRKPKSQANLMDSELIGRKYKLSDTELDIPRLEDELADYSRLYYNYKADLVISKLKIDRDRVDLYKRLYLLCQTSEKLPSDIPKVLPPSTILELIPLEKIIGNSKILRTATEIAKKIYQVADLIDDDKRQIEVAFQRTKKYLELYAPAKIKFEISEKITPEMQKELTTDQLKALKTFSERFTSQDWDETKLEQEIYSIGKEILGKGKLMFQLLYKLLLGKESGPRLAPLLIAMDKPWILNRFQEILPQ